MKIPNDKNLISIKIDIRLYNLNHQILKPLKYPILYSFRRCPYAIRTRWIFVLCQFKVIIREIDLKNKAKELIEISAKGTVPVLHVKKNLVYEESIEIMQYVLGERENEISILGTNESEQNEIYKIININDRIFKYHLDRYKYSTRFDPKSKEFHKLEALKIIRDLDIKIENSKQKWLIGDKISLADIAIFPFIRQFNNVNTDILQNNNDFKNVMLWLDKLARSNNFITTMKKYPVWDKNQPNIIFP